MAEDKRDFLDTVIDIQKDLKALQNPLDAVVDALDPEAESQEPEWNPSLYKEKPRVSNQRCLRCASGKASVCSACVEVCPADAISFEDNKMSVADTCLKCGLCLSACPTEALTDRQHMGKRLYDQIAKIAGAYERCYLTCTRALGRNPLENEVVLPCVGVIPVEVLFAVLTDYPNLWVYLPFGICDKCRTTTGEAAYIDHIDQAEQWTGKSIGLEMDEDAIDHKLKRSYERSQFVNSLVGAGKRAITSVNPMLSGAQALARRISDHSKRINALNRQLDQMVGATNVQKRRRVLTQRRQLVLGAIQKHNALAQNIEHRIPVCDSSKCTMCDDCAKVCALSACAIDDAGHFSVTDVHCIGCAACVRVCPEGALEMQLGDPADLLIPDEGARARAEKIQRQREEVARLKSEGRKKLNQVLDYLESLDTSEDE